MGSFAEFYQEGGFFMHFIALTGIVGAGVLIERFIFLFFRFNINGAQFFNQIQKLVMANNIDRAIKLCNAAPNAALPRIVKAGLTRANKGEVEIQNAVEEASLEVMPQLTKRAATLATLASLATLLGLLGTVMGLIEAFRAVAEAPADQKAAILTKSISLAMNCTAFGLMVGIPALFMHMIVQGIVKKIVDDIDMYSVKLENLLITRGKGGLAEPSTPAE